MIQGAHEGGRSQTQAAWDHLCSAYWYPVYAFVRRRGESPENASDITQAFFTKLIEQNWLAQVQRRETRFSTLLISILKNFLVSQFHHDHAQKRGGHVPPVPLDLALAEHWFGQEPTDVHTPESLFEKRWALAVMEAALIRLRDECQSTGRARIFEVLNPFLSREAGPGDYHTAGQQLGINSRSIAVAVHRLRQDYRAMVQEEVAIGLRHEGMVKEEMKALAAALGA